jgi:pyridoxal phosphate enzyme (YggS family)
MKTAIAHNLRQVTQRIAEACAETGRKPDDITILAVTKGHSAGTVQAAVRAGLTNIGENRVQEADEKISELGKIARWHMIGHLQTNKVKKAVELFDVIQSIDSLRVAEEINKRAGEAGKLIECYIEINSSGEEQKTGVDPSETLQLITQVRSLSNIKLSGLMTVGPLTESEESIRKSFVLCRGLFKKGRDTVGEQFANLSMGMSSDFELAIAEGSTMIRVGTAIFGARNHA